MDKLSTAFSLPHARAIATHSGPSLDRISVRDYVRSAEIGAFSAEFGVDQRLRFNIVLEVTHSAGPSHDDVDQIISYDTITEAVDAALAAERVELLETLAERVAQGCLVDPRAVRVFVRVEKLDRIPGALGVEIERARVPASHPRLRPLNEAAVPAEHGPLGVVFLSDQAAASDHAPAWREALAQSPVPLVVCVSPSQPVAGTRPSVSARRIGLLAIEQAAWAFVDGDDRFEVIGTRTEMDHALRLGTRPVWAPARMVVAAGADCDGDARDPAELALWLAEQLHASDVLFIDSPPPAGSTSEMRLHRVDPDGHEAALRLLAENRVAVGDPPRPEA